MPIVEVEIVRESEAKLTTGIVRLLADALGQAFCSAPGHTWVKLRHLSSTEYAENEAIVQASELPVFVTVLHAHLPQGEALTAEVRAVTLAIANCLGCASDCVHVQYAPPAAGRQAFGGTVVR